MVSYPRICHVFFGSSHCSPVFLPLLASRSLGVLSRVGCPTGPCIRKHEISLTPHSHPRPYAPPFTRKQEKKIAKFVWLLIILAYVFVPAFIGGIGDLVRFQSMAGYFVFIFLIWLLSAHRSSVNWRPVVCGYVIQYTMALLILKTMYVSSRALSGRPTFATVSFSCALIRSCLHASAQHCCPHVPSP